MSSFTSKSEDGRNPVNSDESWKNAQDPWNGDQAHNCGPNTVNQPKALTTSTGPYLNPEILEEITRQRILTMCPTQDP